MVYFPLMTKRQKELRRGFFAKCGPNVATLAAVFGSLPNIAFYIKDTEGRIIAINRYNCELCNIPSPDAAIGKRSSDLFPPAYADFCMARDREVIATGKPIVNRRYAKVANLSASANILSIHPVYGLDGAIVGTLCTYHRDAKTPVGPIWEDRFDAILEKINANIAKPLSVEGLAAEARMSVSNFQRMFMKIIGVRPGRYIIQQRLNAACRLLEGTDLGIYDIALATGFCDQSHFTKMFKSLRGMSPGVYRKTHATISS